MIAAAISCVGGSDAAAEPLPPVRDVQQALSELGYDVGVVDGKWGKRTERALQAFQSSSGLPPTGILDPATARRLAPKRTDLRAEMARKPGDRKELLLVRSSAEAVTLYRLARTGIGSCRPAHFDLAKVRERVRAKFRERFAELDRILEGTADREVTGLLFLDEGFRARTCDGWVAMARAGGAASDPQSVAADPSQVPFDPSPPPTTPKSAPRTISANPPVESPVAVTASPSLPPTNSEPPMTTSGSGSASVWGAFVALSSVIGLVLWRRRRRTSPNSTSFDVADPVGKVIAEMPVRDSRGSVPTSSLPSNLAKQIAEHNLAVIESIRGRVSAGEAPLSSTASAFRMATAISESATSPCDAPALEPLRSELIVEEMTQPPESETWDFRRDAADSTTSKPTLSEWLAAHNRMVGDVIRARVGEAGPKPNATRPLTPAESFLAIGPEPVDPVGTPADRTLAASLRSDVPESSDFYHASNEPGPTESKLSEQITVHNRAVGEMIRAGATVFEPIPFPAEPPPTEPFLSAEPEPFEFAVHPTSPAPRASLLRDDPDPFDLHPAATGPMSPEPALSERIAAHNRAVAEAIRSRERATDTAQTPDEQVLPLEPDLPIAFTPVSAVTPPTEGALRDKSLSELVAARNRAAVEMARAGESATDRDVPSLELAMRRAVPGPIPQIAVPPAVTPTSSPRVIPGTRAEWLPCGVSTTVAGLVIPGGLIWVGGSLPRRNDRARNENCLIDPTLTVATKRDLSGQYMPYWPSYSEIHPWSRRAYLDWLAGPRSDPETYIGYVFLYFYGLERRLMLDEGADDRDVIRGEVERLLAVYGGNHSFRRYASDLLSAVGVRQRGADVTPEINHDIAGYEVPLDVKIALGARVRDGSPIEPDLLLALVRTHPETRLRTPARRAAAELRDLFVAEVERRFPKGVKVGGASRIRKLSVTYKAASGTFEIELLQKSLGLPDITGLSEPVGTARAILDECTARLDAYSRDLGKSPGLAPSLAIFGKLPLEIRLDRVAKLPGDPLATLQAVAVAGEPTSLAELAERLGLPGNGSIDKGRLREWSALLAGLGYGITCDPAWALRGAKAETPVVVFPLPGPSDGLGVPSEGYRHAQIKVALAMMVALADGVVEPSEQRALVELIERADGLDVGERRRLAAEIRVQKEDPHALTDLKARLKALPVEVRGRLADEIVTVAGADGIVDPREVALLEKLFRQIDVDERTLYARLHGGMASAAPAGSGMDGVQAASDASTPPTTISPPRAGGIDPAKLDAIRNATIGVTSVLSEIFAEEEPEEMLPVTVVETASADDESALDGLDGRHRSLVVELLERAEWSKNDFDRLVRGVGLMPGAAIETLNDWAYDRFDECLLEGDDPIVANAQLIPPDLLRVTA